MTTIGLVANVYNEANALPGWLETHLPFFDDVRVLHAGPGGEFSNDGTIEILEKWKVPVQFCVIDDGFGVVRTKALRMCPCDWIMLLDADERFYPVHRVLTCHGDATPQSEVDWILQQYDFRGVRLPNWENISLLGKDLRVEVGEPYDQGKHLRELLMGAEVYGIGAMSTIRRHWHDMTLTRPTQDWRKDPDWQLRLVRNDPGIYFDPAQRMHERLVMSGNMLQSGMDFVTQSHMDFGPFFDHFHFTFKRMEQKQRAHDVAIYDAIHEGREPPKWEEYKREGCIQ